MYILHGGFQPGLSVDSGTLDPPQNDPFSMNFLFIFGRRFWMDCWKNLLGGVGEIVGGSQREERLEVLEKRIKEMQIDKEELWWYLDLRRFGSVPHSGFGLGFERLVQFTTGMNNIRDVIPFPRTPQNAAF